MPCGVCVSLPTGYWMACAAAVPAAPKAQPAASEASIICSRASMFLPSFTAVRRALKMFCSARMPNTSLSTFLPTKTFFTVRSGVTSRGAAVKLSIAWVRASAPDTAVSPGGHDSVSSGSHTATRGIR